MAKLKPNQFILSGHLITEIPILFQTEMVQANLADRKTQTRRVIKPEPESVNTEIPVPMAVFNEKMNTLLKKGLVSIRSNTGGFAFPNCKYGKPGDLLWVRETHADLNNGLLNSEPFFVYKADLEHPDQHGPVTWKPSIHMTKSASRLWLMVEEIRVERVQDITEEDAKAEGVEKKGFTLVGDQAYVDYTNPMEYWLRPVDSFRSLWFYVNGQESWNSNPWVWVIKYRILSKTGRPSDEVILKNHVQILFNELLLK